MSLLGPLIFGRFGAPEALGGSTQCLRKAGSDATAFLKLATAGGRRKCRRVPQASRSHGPDSTWTPKACKKAPFGLTLEDLSIILHTFGFQVR